VLMKIFQDWAERNNEIAAGRMSSIQFGKAMKERGFEGARTTSGARAYLWIFPKNIDQGD